MWAEVTEATDYKPVVSLVQIPLVFLLALNFVALVPQTSMTFSVSFACNISLSWNSMISTFTRSINILVIECL